MIAHHLNHNQMMGGFVTMMRISVVSIIITAVFLVSAGAQTSGSGRMYSLDDCLKIAADQNYDIKSAAAQYQAQNANLLQAFGTFLPSINASMGYSRQLNVEGGRTVNIGGQVLSVGGTQPNSYSMSATASYSIFNGFAREANYNRAQSELDATDYSYRRVRQNIAYQVRSTYINVLRSMQVYKIRKENIDLGNKELDRIKALHEAGRVPIGSIYSQEADVGTRELDAVSSENQLNQAKAQLLTILALPPDQRADFLESSYPTTVDDNTLADFRREIGSYNAAVAKAMESRSDFQSTAARIEAAQSGVTAAHANYMPDLNANGGWSWSNTEFGNFGDNGRYYLSMSLSIPIFDNFNASTQSQQATINVQQRQIERAQAEQRLRSEVQSAFLNLDAAEKQLEISTRSLKSAEQNYNSAKERFTAGAATMLDYLTANTQFVTAKINRVNAVYNYFDAQAQVRFAMGTLQEK